MKKRINYFYPLLIAALVAVGMLAGARFQEAPAQSFQQEPEDKLDEAIRYILNSYVDTLDKEAVVEEAIKSVLHSLDPHSTYIPAKQVKAMNEPLQGEFEGIGIEFNILQDTIIVVSPISGGPSEALGIRAGDRIIEVEGENIAGEGITNMDVIERLRGETGTTVNVTIKRPGHDRLMDFAIERAEIPIHSVEAAYMEAPTVGYIKVNRFSRNTVPEFRTALKELEGEGMESLILDLRGNPGGYLNAAIQLADEFLPKDQLVVYTEGAHRPMNRYSATSRGEFEDGNLVILIDEGSASASEIVAGAVQDWDRGLIVGRRSFGKGLVQEPYVLPDGSVMRLTVARYYTPTGRSIQKSYEAGYEAYKRELRRRFERGELVNPDTIQFPDSLRYETPGGRIVYGGGGIMPDLYVPFDTTANTEFLNEIFGRGLVNEFTLRYVDRHRQTLEEAYPTLDEFESQFKVDGPVLDNFIQYVQAKDIQVPEKDLDLSIALLKNHLKALIGRQFWGNEGYFKIINSSNRAYKRAIEVVGSERLTEFGVAGG